MQASFFYWTWNDFLVVFQICDELNDPRLSRIREWRAPRGTWKYILHDSPLHYDKVSSNFILKIPGTYVIYINLSLHTIEQRSSSNWQFAMPGYLLIALKLHFGLHICTCPTQNSKTLRANSLIFSYINKSMWAYKK